jgi:hypothetical protein
MRRNWLASVLGIGFGSVFGLVAAAGLEHLPVINWALYTSLGIIPPYLFAIRGTSPPLGGAVCGGTAMFTYYLVFGLMPNCTLGTEWTGSTAFAAKLIDVLAWSVPSVVFAATIYAVWCWFSIRTATAIAKGKFNIGMNP